jgi:hypothetical protein
MSTPDIELPAPIEIMDFKIASHIKAEVVESADNKFELIDPNTQRKIADIKNDWSKIQIYDWLQSNEDDSIDIKGILRTRLGLDAIKPDEYHSDSDDWGKVIEWNELEKLRERKINETLEQS